MDPDQLLHGRLDRCQWWWINGRRQEDLGITTQGHRLATDGTVSKGRERKIGV